jgi:hypothetical protein
MPPRVVCPAGEYVVDQDRGPGVRCAIENRHIAVLTDPKTVMGWCSHQYDGCPSWRAAREGDEAVLWAHGQARTEPCETCEGTGALGGLWRGLYVPAAVECPDCEGSGQWRR